ncbi:integrase, catalytic region domain protein [Burkholderia pseudomallei]|nr:integrase, catalytic region domain protein [Burkholderia pseudomallei]AJX84407.1 integrase, catalytic region domain protein [Burkholderia pseudomallei 7894]KGV68590.1 integrase, catalytic region domain protein [Burkholderia pseudomallei MSHR4299]AIV74442.1 integrase, catalytic region domain protein [Burkholderia pseudomallei]KGD54897.1 integrase, catalytic region domain protein [Burkholderia pseudomallei]
MWPRPVVVELPLFDSQVDCLLCRGMVGPKLVPVSKLRTFNLAIEVWRAWWNWPEFDALVHQAPLHGFSEELAAAVGLDTLNRKRHLLDDAIKEKQRISGISTGVDGQHTKA